MPSPLAGIRLSDQREDAQTLAGPQLQESILQ